MMASISWCRWDDLKIPRQSSPGWETRESDFSRPPGIDTAAVRGPRDPEAWRVAALGREIDDTKLIFRRGEASETVAVPRAIVANDTHVTALVAERVGTLALLPHFAAPEGWHEVLADWQLGPIELNALTAPERGSLPKVRLFLDALRLCIGTVPDLGREQDLRDCVRKSAPLQHPAARPTPGVSRYEKGNP